ncbi:MAG: transposase [Candidatus Saccharimonadales bacterium]
MSKRNTIRRFDVPAYYHVYNRGVHKEKIFLDAQDKAKFMQLLARYLDPTDESVRADGVVYEKSSAKLLAYCLMGNHFHLLLYQDEDVKDIQKLLSAVSTAYSMYYNLRYKRSGRLFEGPYQASRIDSDSYLMHISRYIHLNPRTYLTYQWSSIHEYTGDRKTPWVYTDMVHDMSPGAYKEFLRDYEERREFLKTIHKALGL